VDRAPSPPRFWSLDALRGACALVVFLSHWHLWSNFVPQGVAQRFTHAFLENGHEWLTVLTWPTGGHHPAVIAFFVLSGFCIHYPTEWRLAQGDQRFATADYYQRRLQRIMPVYWFASLLGLLLVGLEAWRASGDPLLQFHAQSSVTHALVRFAGLAGLYPEEVFVGNYILNTVAAEITMYAVYPLFHRLAAARRWGALGTAFLLMHLGAVGLLRLGVSPYWVFNSLFMLGLFWFAGALLAHGFVARRWRLAGGWPLGLWLVFLATKQLPHFYGLNLIKQALWGAVCAAGLLWVLTLEERHGTWSRQGLVRLLCFSGAVSYSLYAVHTPVILLVSWALHRGGLENYFIQLPLTLLASMAATVACYRWIEQRFYRPRVVPASPA
jgi:peptidoglycan/LPS O-acetylase OafA/YrhL